MSAIVPEPGPRRVGRLVVVGDEPEVPVWVRTWCRRTGRELRTHLTPVVEPAGRVSLPVLIAAIGPCLDDPVLVLRRAPTVGRQVTVALRALPDDMPVLAEAARAARDLGGTVQVVHGVPVSFGPRSVGLDGAVAAGYRLLDGARRRLEAEVPDVVVITRLVRAYPHEVVGGEADGDLLVVGGPSATAPYGPYRLGPVTSSALHHARCALVVPRRRTGRTRAA